MLKGELRREPKQVKKSANPAAGAGTQGRKRKGAPATDGEEGADADGEDSTMNDGDGKAEGDEQMDEDDEEEEQAEEEEKTQETILLVTDGKLSGESRVARAFLEIRVSSSLC